METKISEIRKEYTRGKLTQCTINDNPFEQFEEWLNDAIVHNADIKNQFNLPQKGIKYHDEDRLSYDVMDTTIEMSTTLSKNPQCGREWCYKGISHIVVKYSGPISDPIDGGTIYFEPYYNHHIWFDKKKYGEWGILYSKVYIITRIKNANIEDVRDYGISGEDGSIFFQYVEKVVDDNM